MQSDLHAARVLSRASSPEGALRVTGAPVELLHELFLRQVASAPNSEAVICGTTRLTYAQLDRLSDALARLLVSKGIGPNTCVAFLLERGALVYVALIGILKAGAAYVPIDPDHPAERVAFILSDCKAAALFTSPTLVSKSAGFAGEVLLLPEGVTTEPIGSPESFEQWSCPARPEDLCYVIYTSGTTGRPKGVEIEHRSACHFVQAEGRLFQVRPDDRVFQGFSIAFDASVEEIWLALANGAALVVGKSETIQSGPGLSRWLADAGVTVLSCVPTLLAMLDEDIPTVRLLILGGEVCSPALIKRWWSPRRRVINTYGPTEATVVATWTECAPDKPVTIGRPLPGYTAVVVNERLELAGTHEPGELLLGGAALARGYLGKPDLTAEKFIMCSFDDGPPRRFYRTGDLARWTPDGELEFLGRIDTQVKIRGFRVELSEIEAVLLECAEVQGAAVVLQEDEAGCARLIAYVVPRPGQTADKASLRSRLRERLPAYMVPALIEVLAGLPRLPSGKIDRKSLPTPCSDGATPSRDSVQPRNPLERQLIETWSRHFGISDISITDDFFVELGGHSLLAARTVSELRRIRGFESLSVADVYRSPTAAGLADELELRLKAARPATETVRGEAQAGGHAIPFWRHFFCGFAQLFSLVFVLGFFALQWLAPYLTYTVLVEEEYDVTSAILLAFASLVLVYPVMLTAAIALKWIIIGRYKPGNYPLWGWYYFRFWLATAIEGTVPVSYLSGTPLLNIYLRLMGAKIGRNVFLSSDNFAIYDLLEIGEDTSINADATLLGYSVSDGLLRIGRISVGKGCFVGARATIGENSFMADGSTLEDLSLLPNGQKIGHGETWMGSPAQLRPDGNQTRRAEASGASKPEARGIGSRYVFAHAVGLLIFPVLVVAALFPGIAVMNRLNYLDPYYWYLLLSPLIAVSFVVLLCAEIVLLKWLLLGRIRAGQHRLDSWYYIRKWFVDKTMELSLDVVGPLYASVYLSPWYKLLGAKLGYGAEISTASFISPDLLSIGEESFIADNASLGAPRVRDGLVSIGPNHIGRRAFIGNSALLPPGTAIGDDVLIGCLSAPPEDPAEAMRRDTAWLGSPALFLPQRLRNPDFSEETTYSPTTKLRVLRAAIEFVRVITPSTGFIILTSLLFSALLLLHDVFSLGQTLLFFPALYLGCGLAAAGFTIVMKWILVGRYRPGEKPLWSTFVWRNELINALHEHLAGPFLVGAMTGTPFICWYLRLLGSRIGRRVFVETTDFSEFDLVRIGNEATLNSDCTIQTHLFEDRVMKMSHLEIGAGCSVGANSLVLYDTKMEPRSSLGPLSLLMKGEVLTAGTAWRGIPAQASSNA